MITYKKFWTNQYQREAGDWQVIIARPVLNPDGKWTYGGPAKITDEIGDAMVLAMGNAPRELVDAKIGRAKEVVEAVDRLDLLNTDSRHARLETSKIDYLRGKLLIELMEGRLPSISIWRELALLQLQLFDALKEEGTSAPYEKLVAALYFLLAHEYSQAKQVMDGMRRAKGYELELSALKALTAEIAANGVPVRNSDVRAQALDYFDQMRNPDPPRVPGQPYRQFDKTTLDKFEWALLIGEMVDPGDGILDARRALAMVSR